MHPILFEFDTPSFLQGILPSHMTIYSYGFMIALGAYLAYLWTATQSKKEFGVPYSTSQNLILVIIVAAVVGGKFFVIFENPSKYLSNPGELLKNFQNGFVFYGSLLFAIPAMIFFFRKNKLPILPMLDIIAITATIVHGVGRLGCFMAGCCYGTPHDSFPSVTFTDPHSAAKPLDTPLHPTQLYSSFSIFLIMGVLLLLRRHKKFDGEIFMVYLMLYAIARSILEIFRGDLSRGYVIEGVISNSQFIALFVFIGGLVVYLKLRGRYSTK